MNGCGAGNRSKLIAAITAASKKLENFDITGLENFPTEPDWPLDRLQELYRQISELVELRSMDSDQLAQLMQQKKDSGTLGKQRGVFLEWIRRNRSDRTTI